MTTPVATVSPTASQASGPLDLDINVIPDQFTSQLAVVHSLGNEIVWANDRDLYRYVPGEAQPELVYSAPAGSSIPNFAGSSAGYAIITQVTPKDYISFQWRLWYLQEPGAVPVLLDQYDNDQMPLPTLSMDDRRIAWTRTRGTGDNVVSELRIVEIAAPDEPQTLATYPFHDVNVEGPALHGDELWYGIRNNDWDLGTESPHVEMLDLAHPDAPPQIYGAEQRAFQPAVNDQVVVWKGGGVPDDSADTWGTLFVYWRSDGSIESVPGAGGRVTYPSVGDRFVAWWDAFARLYVYDLQTRAVRTVLGSDPGGGTLPASVAGSLLAFKGSPGSQPSKLRWAFLPN